MTPLLGGTTPSGTTVLQYVWFQSLMEAARKMGSTLVQALMRLPRVAPLPGGAGKARQRRLERPVGVADCAAAEPAGRRF